VAAGYDRAAKEIAEPDLKELLTRIRDHELYRRVGIFGNLLKGEKM
jgi:hypothetical protein